MSQRRIDREQWRVLVSDHAVSGESVSDFCKRREIPPAQFYRWRKKFALASEQAQQPKLVPLHVVSQTVVEVELSCGATIKLPVDNEVATRSILATLIDLGSGR